MHVHAVCLGSGKDDGATVVCVLTLWEYFNAQHTYLLPAEKWPSSLTITLNFLGNLTWPHTQQQHWQKWKVS